MAITGCMFSKKKQRKRQKNLAIQVYRLPIKHSKINTSAVNPFHASGLSLESLKPENIRKPEVFW